MSRAFILASASPRRQSLLSDAGYRFDVVPAEADESLPAGVPPADAAVEIALRKAAAVARLHPGSLVLGADTIVVAPGSKVLGKPLDENDARKMLRELSGSTHVVITGVAIIDSGTGRRVLRAVSTSVVFGRMTAADIDAYVASGEALGKAGAYAIQETGDRFVKSVDGSFTNVVGLPMEAIAEMLADFGIRPTVRRER